MSQKILVTGCAGFIGMHLCMRLLKDGFKILGIDNLNDYYSIELKKTRLNNLVKDKNFTFELIDICDKDEVNLVIDKFAPQKIINFAAQAGVRYSLKNPQAYIKSNILGFINILEACKNYKVESLIYASSSSVYGLNEKTPFNVNDVVDKPISVYATSKISNELLAFNYSHLYGLRTTGLRFFTVYGPWGRPDMAIYIFTEKINAGETIEVFNGGNMKRDFTYIDDIIEGTKSAISKNYKNEIFNLGNNKSVDLMNVISIIEKNLNKKAKMKFSPLQSGDVERTFADIKYSTEMLDYQPRININDGVRLFLNWYRAYSLK
tara:strand:- start:1978 stop:2937 length:960 start_codon:yes stop_codon:yes gene_type:complete